MALRKLIISLLCALLAIPALPVSASTNGGAGVCVGNEDFLSSAVASKKKKKIKTVNADTLESDIKTREKDRLFSYYFHEVTRYKKIMPKFDACYAILMHCLEIYPHSSAVLYELAQYYIVMQQVDQGVAALEKAVKYAPDNYWYGQGLASIYMQRGEYEKAAAVMERLFKIFPGNSDILYTLLQIYNRNGSFEKSIELLDKLEVRMGKSEQISMQKYAIYDQMNEKEKALGEIKALSEEFPAEPRFKVMLGDVYLPDNPDEAYKIYKSVLDVEPDNAQAMYSLASYYEQTGKTEEYDRQINKVLLNKKVEPETKVDVMRSLVARNEAAKKDSTEIINLFEKIIQQESDDAQLPMLYAQYLYSKKMEDKALPVLRQVLQIEPENTAARMALLSSAVKEEDYDEVIDLSATGIETDPDILEFHYYLAASYQQTQRTDSIISVAQRAVKHITKESDKSMASDIYAILGDAYHAKGRNSEAYAAYDTSLVYNQDNIMALNNYAYYLSLDKINLDKAEEMSYRTVKAEPDNATYLDTYAWILFQKGNYVQAKLYIDQALKNGDIMSADVLDHSGDIYFKNGDIDKAIRAWEAAKKLSASESDVILIDKKIQQRKYIEK